ncbi:hypothetical protein KR044_002745, partial [Drosophila immigrans]
SSGAKAVPATPSNATVRLSDATAGQDAADGLNNGADLKLQSYVNGNGNGVYKIIRTLGKGNFAKVKLAIHMPTGREVAIKVIDKTELNSTARQKLYREVRIMKLLDHPNIVRLFQVIESERTLYLIMEYASRGELFDHLVKNGRIRERDARVIFRQLVSAIQYCHSKFVVHRDLKAENLLLDQHMNIKIADFGFGNTFNPNAQLETFCGSPPYAAPELFMGRKYAGPEVDAWSLGVVLYTLVSGSLPFDGGTLKELREHVLRGKYRVPYYISMDCENLMRKFLVLNPDKRATLNAVMADKWLNLGYEDTDRLRPFQERPLDLQDPVRIEQLLGLGYKRRDVLNSLRAQAFDDIYCSYMLLALPKPRSSRHAADASEASSSAAKHPASTHRPAASRLAANVAAAVVAATNNSVSTSSSAVSAPPAKPTRRTFTRGKNAASNTAAHHHASSSASSRSPQTPHKRSSTAQSNVNGNGNGNAVDVKPTLLSAQRQLAQTQKMANSPQRYFYQGSSARRPATLYEKGESPSVPSTPSTPSTTSVRQQLGKSPMSERRTLANGPTAPTTRLAAGQAEKPPSEKHFTRSNVARATFHFGQGRSVKHGRSGASDDDGGGYPAAPPLSADDTKPASRVGFFSKLTARFGRRVIQLNEKETCEQRKNLTK